MRLWMRFSVKAEAEEYSPIDRALGGMRSLGRRHRRVEWADDRASSGASD